MNRRILGAAVLFLFALCVTAPCWGQADAAAQAASSASQAAPAQKILSKDLDYLLLLNPPTDNEFLQSYSPGYRAKKAEIEAKVAGISDPNLRKQTFDDEWSSVPNKDQDKFKAEADKAYYEAKIAFLQAHPGAWFEVGRAAYDEPSHSLAVTASPMAAIAADFRVAMDAATINQIYEKFHQIASHELDEKADDYVAKAAAGSMCAQNSVLCYKLTREDMEKSARAARMVVVAQADFEARKIERLLLVDYQTEAVLQELDPHIPAPYRADWRFSPVLPPPPPAEPPPAAVQAQASAAAETQPSADQPKQPSDSANTRESANPQPISDAPAKPLHVPANVEAASIISRAAPVYPLKARATRVQGDVVLYAIIDKEGKVSQVRVLSGDDLLSPAAIEAVRQWRYKPLLVDGEPKEVDTTITVTFALSE